VGAFVTLGFSRSFSVGRVTGEGGVSLPKPLIVIVSGSPFDGVRRSARGLSESLARHVNVLFVDPTRSSLRADRAATLRPALRNPAPNLFHLESVTVPAHTRFAVRRVVKAALEGAVKTAIEQIGVGSPRAVFLQTPQVDLLGRFGEEVSVYWATDSFMDGSALMGVDHLTLVKAELASAAKADLVIAVTDPLASLWVERGKRVAVVRNGVDLVKEPTEDVSIPDDLTLSRPTAGVVGTLSNRLDFDMLKAVADSGIAVLLLGPASFRTDRSGFDALCDRPNVLWLGPKEHGDLLRYYRHIDVGLVPYTLSEFNRVSAPLKPLEYLATGLPVVSTRLPGVAAIGSPDITFADDRSAFVVATEQAIEASNDADLVERRRLHAHEWSWDRRAVDVLRLLGLESR